ncbi:MAG: uncharacterized protein JWN13_5408 [Betaproteobacteria bacterium]|nr:uncharacterized protein [Betaproteobacteria bacterium]
MTQTVDYKPLANGVGANVESQAQYLADLAAGGALEGGYKTGVVTSERFNKTLRQSSMMIAALANQIAAKLAVDVLDDGDLAALQTLINNAFLSYLPPSAHAQRMPYSTKALESRSINEFATSSAQLTGGADAFNAIQYAFDAMGAGDFSHLIIPPNVTLLVTGSDRVMVLANTLAEATVEWQGNAQIVTENSDNPNAPPGNYHFITLEFFSPKLTLINPRVRGGTTYIGSDIADVWGGKFWNLHNAGITVGDEAFTRINLFGTQFEVSLATAITIGNFAAVQRAAIDTSKAGGMFAAFGVRMFGMSGGINVHSLEHLVIAGSLFKGGNGNHFKVSTADNGATGPSMNATVTGNTFDGAPADPTATNNLHLTGVSPYCGFIQRFSTVDVSGGNVFRNYAGTAVLDFLDGSQLDANLNIDGNRFQNITAGNSVRGLQGNWSHSNNHYETCSPVEFGTLIYSTRTGCFNGNVLKDTAVVAGDNGRIVHDWSKIEMDYNHFDYGVAGDAAPLRSASPGSTFTAQIHLKNTTIQLRGANLNAIALSSGSPIFRSNNLTLSAEAAGTILTPGLSRNGAFPDVMTSGGLTNVPNNSPTTIFTPTRIGRRLLFVTIAGGTQQAVADIVYNGTSLAILNNASTSASLAISVSGGNVQVTQTNGGARDVAWGFQFVGPVQL